VCTDGVECAVAAGIPRNRHPRCTLNALDAHSTVSPPAIRENLKNVNQPKEPQDATETTEEQRRQQEQLEHQHEDPDGPGLHQSRRNVPDESTR
jgi:hypothetical protein